jgi:hypothetical protein
MTKDEALDLALEALEHMLEDAKQERLTVEYWNECVDAITAIKQARSAPVHKPVAWMHTMLDDVVVGHRPADLNVHPDRWMPLYKDPTPCKTCEALARTVMMDQTAHDTTPPAARPAVPDAFGTREGEHPQYIQGWNDCRAETNRRANASWSLMCEKMVAAEREACAKLADQLIWADNKGVASAIRARGKS